MASKSLTFDIFGRDKTASKTLKGIGKEAEGLGSKLGKLAGAVGLAYAGKEILDFGVSSVKAFAEAEKAQAKLSDAFERFPDLSDSNIKAFEKLNTSLAKKTRFDDDATAAGEAVLAQYKLTGKQILRLTPLLQDYAAKTGKDLPTAAGDLGKALFGQGRALKAIGVDFSDTGSLAGNFDSIVGSLSEKVGGFAEKEGTTASGRLEILKNRFGEVQEKIGEAFMPALDEAADAIETDFMPAVEGAAAWLASDGIPALGEFAKGFAAVQKASYDFGYAVGPHLQVAYDALFKFGQDIEPILSDFFDFWHGVGYNIGETYQGFVADKEARDAPKAQSIPTPIIKDRPRGGKLPMLATGGTALAAGVALIGERGPELIHMPKGASVIPLDRAGSGGGASVTQNIYPTPGMSETTIGRISANSLNAQLRRSK